MSKTDLFRRIACIGSIEYQRRLIVHGTAESYVLLDELLDTTMYAAKHLTKHPVFSLDFTQAEREALLTFHARVDPLFDRIPWSDRGITNEYLVERDPAVKEIREAANDCLRSAGISFALNDLLDY